MGLIRCLLNAKSPWLLGHYMAGPHCSSSTHSKALSANGSIRVIARRFNSFHGAFGTTAKRRPRMHKRWGHKGTPAKKCPMPQRASS